MIKKFAVLSFALILTACNAPATQTNLLEDQSQVNAAGKADDKNSLFGLNVNGGSADFVFNKQNSFDKEISNTPSVQIYVKRLGVKVHNSNTITLVMPSGDQMKGYTRIANDGNLYVEDYGTDKYYKVGSWTKKDKFKGKGFINVKDESYKLFSQDFDVKVDPIVKDVKATLPLNPMSHKYVYFHLSSEIKPVSKSTLNFDLSKFIATK